MSRFGIRSKGPSLTRGFFFAGRIFAGVLCIFIFTGAWTNVHETKEEVEGKLLGRVSVVRPDFIALVYSDNEKGTEYEIPFSRHPDIQLINKSKWSDIHEGEEVLAEFIEYRRVREGRSLQGAFRRESAVLGRLLEKLQFEESSGKRQLASGLEE